MRRGRGGQGELKSCTAPWTLWEPKYERHGDATYG